MSPGVPGTEARLPLALSEGVNRRRLDINAFMAVQAINAMRIYRIYPRKGTITTGSDADLAIRIPVRRFMIGMGMPHEPLNDTPCKGFEVEGWPDTMISRGKDIVEGTRVLADCGRPDPPPATGGPS